MELSHPPPQTHNAEVSRRISTLQWIILGVIFVSALGLRFTLIERMSLHADEVWHLELAMGRGAVHGQFEYNRLLESVPPPTKVQSAAPWTAVWNGIQGITHPPIYWVSLRWWCELFGTSDLATRGYSAAASALAVLALFDVLRRLHGTAAALWSAAIMALANPQIELAQEIRPYGLLTLFCLLAADVLIMIHQTGGRRWHLPLLALTVLLSMLTHYFALGTLLGLGLFTVLVMRGKSRGLAIAAFALAAGIFAIVWLPNMLDQRQTVVETADNWLISTSEKHAWQTFRRLGDVPFRLFLHTDLGGAPLRDFSIAIVLVTFVMLKRRRDLAFVCCWMAGTLGLVLMLDLVRSTEHLKYNRYFLLAGPAIYALPAVLVMNFRPLIRMVPPAVTALSCLCALPILTDLVKAPYRDVAVALDAHRKPGEAVVIFNWLDTNPDWGRFVWLGMAHYSKQYPWPFMVVEGKFDAAARQQLQNAKGIWIVAPAGSVAPEEIAPAASPQHRDYLPGLAEIYLMPPPVISPAH